MDGPGADGIGKRQYPVAQMTLEGRCTTVDPVGRKGGVERGRCEPVRGLALDPRGVAELHLAAAIGQFLGHHPMPARPAVVEGVGLALGIRGAPAGHDEAGKMLMPRPPGPAFAGADARSPGCGVHLELAAPPPGEIEHLIRKLRRRQDRRRQPVEMHRRIAFDFGRSFDEGRKRVDREVRPIVEAKRFVPVTQKQPVLAFIGIDETEAWQKRPATCIAQDEAGLARKAARRFGADRQLRIAVEHAACHVDCMGARQCRQILRVRKPRTPIHHLGQAPAPGGEHQALSAVLQRPVSDHLTAPSVRPAMKCRCIRKNIATGGKAARIDPALTSCHCAIH